MNSERSALPFCCASLSCLAVQTVLHLCECKQLLVSHFQQQPPVATTTTTTTQHRCERITLKCVACIFIHAIFGCVSFYCHFHIMCVNLIYSICSNYTRAMIFIYFLQKKVIKKFTKMPLIRCSRNVINEMDLFALKW